jgi:H2-forming N5,N10-methylenetetrahydromethanopterin dehydrogenase-like enzyme
MGRALDRLFGELGHTIVIADVDTSLRPVEAAKQADVVVIGVPIRVTEDVIREIGPHVREDALMVDVTDYVSELMEKLENVQDILGIIHDHDTTIAYLKQHKGTRTRSTQIHSVLKKINLERQNKYEEFVKFVNGDISLNSNSIFIRTTNVIA